MSLDPTRSNPDLFKVIFENDRVRVLDYKDNPGEGTKPHMHPDRLVYTLTTFKRRLRSAGKEVDVEVDAEAVLWLGAMVHSGFNIGDTDTHVIIIELKEPNPAGSAARHSVPRGH